MERFARPALGCLVVLAGLVGLQVTEASVAAAAHPTDELAPCVTAPVAPRAGAKTPDPDGLAPQQVVADERAYRAQRVRSSTFAARGIVIPVYVHVLRIRAGGGVGGHRIQRQISVLNEAFAGEQSRAAARSPFSFRVVGVDRTVNPRWYRMDEGTITEGHAKRALHRGNANDLNLYIGMNRSGSLGWGTQPAGRSRAPRMDGVVIRRTTMAGGRGGHYSSGDAAVHETGHWLGLLHTFNGRCGKRGDLVADTPREARPSYSCPTRRNTCTAPGRDPVHNFMDYSYDSCMNRFTRGQVSRMRHEWSAFRAGGR